MNMKALPAFLLLLLGPLSGQAQPAFSLTGEREILPVDKAFVLERVRSGDQLLVRFTMPPGYYLYRHRIGGEGIDSSSLPAGLAKHDEFFGDVEVFYSELLIEVPLAEIDGQEMMVSYQGCADAGLCYPPQQRLIMIPPE